MIVASTACLRDSGLGRDEVVAADGLLFMNTGAPDLRNRTRPGRQYSQFEKGPQNPLIMGSSRHWCHQRRHAKESY